MSATIQINSDDPRLEATLTMLVGEALRDKGYNNIAFKHVEVYTEITRDGKESIERKRMVMPPSLQTELAYLLPEEAVEPYDTSAPVLLSYSDSTSEHFETAKATFLGES